MKLDDAAKTLSRKHARKDVADFLLNPEARPDLALDLLPGRKGAPRPGRRGSWVRALARGAVFLSVIAVISCAVGGHNLDPVAKVEDRSATLEKKTATDRPATDRVEPMNAAVSSAWDTAWSMVAGSGMTGPLADTFAARLFQGDWAGLLLLDSEGHIKGVARPENLGAVTEWVTRQRSLEDENDVLRQTMEALSAVQDTEKIYLEIDLTNNRLFVKMGSQVLYDFPVVTGKGFATRESGATRRFQTPRGIISVIEKQVDPVWVPPAWHWTERGQTPPAYRPAMRGHLGKYRLLFPDAIGIHGVGRGGNIRPGKYSHGCIRMSARDLKITYDLSDVGTELYVY